MKSRLLVIGLMLGLVVPCRGDTGIPEKAEGLRRTGVGPTGRVVLEGPMTLHEALVIGLEHDLQRAIAESGMSEVKSSRSELLGKGGPELLAQGYQISGTDGVWERDPGLDALARAGTRESVSVMRARLMIPLFSGGRFSEQMAAAQQAEQAALARVACSQRERAREIRKGYFRVLAQQGRLAVLDWELSKREEVLKKAEQLVGDGRLAPFVLGRYRAEIDSARQRRNLAVADKTAAEAAMKTLLGLDISSHITCTDTLGLPPEAGSVDDNLATALADRPDLVAARHGLKESEHRLASAEADYLPQLHLTGEYASVAGGTGHPMESYPGASGGIALSVPIFSGGLREAEVGRKRTLKQSRERSLEELQAEIAREVVEVRARHDAAVANVELGRSRVEQTTSDLSISLQRHDISQADHLEVLDAMSACSRARQDANSSLADVNWSYADLLYVTGRY
ncbi:MAG: TolC family protein [Armatimonadetes bacterium]|nr:TolC family protein [Armatimonadota bacterium]